MHKNFKTYNKPGKKQHIKTVPTDTSKTQHSDTATPAQTTTSQKQSTSLSHTLATTINKQTGTSGTPPPLSPSPPHNNTPTSSPDSSPDRMPSLWDRVIFFPQTTFDGKDKSKTRTHLQSFEDFVDRQKLDPATDFQEIQEYFLMTLWDLVRQWFSSTKFTSYDDMKKKFTQEYSEYGKTPCEWLKSWTELKYRPDSDNSNWSFGMDFVFHLYQSTEHC